MTYDVGNTGSVLALAQICGGYVYNHVPQHKCKNAFDFKYWFTPSSRYIITGQIYNHKKYSQCNV